MNHLSQVIARAATSDQPSIYLIKRAPTTGRRLGIFASSFNPVTIAHLELMRRAALQFALDERLALAGLANADKSTYEASIEDRLTMLCCALAEEARTSIGLSSHAFFVDMIDALAPLYGSHTELYFILGIDTFARVLDRDDKYTALYHRRFSDRIEALRFLLSRSHLVVAGRAGATGANVQALGGHLPEALRGRLLYLDFPADLAEQSATQVRERVGAGQPIDTLVVPAVERYVREKGLFLPRS